MAAALLSHRANIKVERKNESRLIPIESLFTGDGKDHLALSPGELITAVQIPAFEKRVLSGYLKYRLRKGIDFPLVGVAVSCLPFSKELPQGGLSVGLTGIGSQPINLTFNELPSEGSLAGLIGEKIHPVNNVGGSPWHRQRMAQQLACDLLRKLIPKMGTGIE